MSDKEATARIKINKLLEAAGWRFFADGKSPANIQLESGVTIKTQDTLGENFEKSSKCYIDFLLLNEKGFPFIVLEAKAEDKSPLVGKEQARRYAKGQNCRFVYFNIWQIKQNEPKDFAKGLIGFGKDIENDLLEASSPFVFSTVNERSILHRQGVWHAAQFPEHRVPPPNFVQKCVT